MQTIKLLLSLFVGAFTCFYGSAIASTISTGSQFSCGILKSGEVKCFEYPLDPRHGATEPPAARVLRLQTGISVSKTNG